MKEESVRNFAILGILLVLLTFSFFLLKPIFKAMIFGAVLAYALNPLYQKTLKIVKSRDIAAIIIVALTLLLVILPIIFFMPLLLRQSLEVYRNIQNTDFITPLRIFFPSLFSSEAVSAEISAVVNNFVSNLGTKFLEGITGLLLNIPTFFLQLAIVLFAFYFFLRDQNYIQEYLKSISPFSAETERQLILQSSGIASSVIYGQVFIGLLQGVITGIGLFIFKIPNPLFLTLVACLVSIIPLLGPIVIWVPAVIYLFFTGNISAAIGLLILGIFISTIDNILRPLFIAKRTHIPTSIILFGMIGGIFVFGVLGFILGPLILAYLIILLEIFRNK